MLTEPPPHPNGTPALLGPDGKPISRRDVELGRSYPSGLALPGGWTFQARAYGPASSFWLDRWDEAIRFSRQDAVEMENDPFLMSLLEERMEGTHSLKWQIEVPDEKDPEQVRVRDGLTKLIEQIPEFEDMQWAWLWALWYGRQAVQVEWRWVYFDDRQPEQPDPQEQALMQAARDGDRVARYALADLRKEQGRSRATGDRRRRGLTVASHYVHQGDKIGHLEDGTAYILVNPAEAHNIPNATIIPTTVGGMGLVLRGTWRDRFIIHRHQVRDRDFFLGWDQQEAIHGVGLRSQVFWPNWLRLEALSQVVNFYARVGMGLTVWYYEAGNANALANMQRVAAEQTDRCNLFVPRYGDGKDTGSAVERVEVPTTGTEGVMKLVEFHEKHIERLVIGQEGSASATSSSGHSNQGSSAFQEATKSAKIKTDARRLGVTITGTDRRPGLLNTMQRHTFPGTIERFCARFVFQLEVKESQERLTAIKTVCDLGVKVKADDARAAAGVSKPADGDEVIEPPQQGQPGAGGAGAGGPPGGDPMAALMGGAAQPPAAQPPGEGGGGLLDALREPEGDGERPAPEEASGGLMDALRQMRESVEALRYERCEKPRKHEYASTHVLLPDDIGEELLAMGRAIPAAHLAEDGREDTPHVTAKFGLHGDDPDAVRRVLAGFGPVRVRMGKLAFFPAGESGAGDVVHAEIDSPDLHRLNRFLEQSLPHTRTHPKYKPHATVAYVLPGMGARYAGMPNPLEGRECIIDSLEFSNRDGVKTTLPLEVDRDSGVLEQAGPAQHARLSVIVDRLKSQGKHDLARQVILSYARRMESPRQQRRVKKGTAGAERKQDKLGRSYYDLPGGRVAGNPGGDQPEPTVPHPAPAPPDAPPEPSRIRPERPAARAPAAAPAPAPAPAAQNPPWEPDAATNADAPPSRERLSSSPAARTHQLGGGQNETQLLELEGGGMGVFKPTGGEVPLRRGVRPGTYWRREVAASEVADALGFGDLIPATTVRVEHVPERPSSPGWGELDDGRPTPAHDRPLGSIQAYVSHAAAAADLPKEEAYDGERDAARAAVLDYLLGHLDRHAGNWLVKDGKLHLIDNGLSFPHSYHAEDFFNMRFWRHSDRRGLALPDVSHLADRWPQVESILRRNGLEEAAIRLAAQRFDAVTSGRYHRVADLPSPVPGYARLGDMAEARQRASRPRKEK